MSSFDGKQEFDLNGIFISELKSESFEYNERENVINEKNNIFSKDIYSFF